MAIVLNVSDVQEYAMQLQTNVQRAMTIITRINGDRAVYNVDIIYEWLVIYDILYGECYQTSANVLCKVGKYDMGLPNDANIGSIILFLASRCQTYLEILDRISQHVDNPEILNHMVRISDLQDSVVARQFLESWIGG